MLGLLARPTTDRGAADDHCHHRGRPRSSRAPSTEGRSEAELKQLVRHAGAELELAPAEVIIEWAVATFGAALRDHLLDGRRRAGPRGRARSRPASTWCSSTPATTSPRPIGTRDAVEATLPVNLISITPVQSVAEQDATYGKDLFARDPDLCCALRKVKPLEDALSAYDAWATGLRRDETHNRVIAPVIGWDEKKRKVKVSPLARWTGDDVDRYIARERRAGQPAAVRRLPVDRLLAVHPPRRAGRGPAQRPLGRHRQDRVRHPPVTHPVRTPDSAVGPDPSSTPDRRPLP